jgi:hypothetical protein
MVYRFTVRFSSISFPFRPPAHLKIHHAGHWGLSAPNANEVSFTHHNDLKAFFEVAKEVGVLVVLRPGYVSQNSLPFLTFFYQLLIDRT